MDTLIKLAQLGPAGLGLAFALLAYWLLSKEQSLTDKQGNPVEPRHAIIGLIRVFLPTAMIFFIVGVAANLVTVFAEKIVQANSKTLEAAVTPDSVSARFTAWTADESLSFGVSSERLDLSRFVSKKDQDAFRLVVAIREKTATPNDAGTFPLAFGYYPFDLMSPQNVPPSDVSRKILASGCVQFVLFRVPQSATSKPITEPFDPGAYGSDIKAINAAYDGQKCP